MATQYSVHVLGNDQWILGVVGITLVVAVVVLWCQRVIHSNSIFIICS